MAISRMPFDKITEKIKVRQTTHNVNGIKIGRAAAGSVLLLLIFHEGCHSGCTRGHGEV